MKNCFALLSLLFISGLSFGQNVPTLLSWEVDTLCDGVTENIAVNIQVQDLDADSTWIQVTNYDFIIYSFVAADPAPPLVGGQQIRTFTIYGFTGTGIPAGLNLSDVDIDIYSDNALDIGGPWAETITNTAAYGDLGASIDLAFAGMCENDQPHDLTPFASPSGGEFIWGDEKHEGHMFDPVLYLQDPSNVTYIYTNGAGCEDYAFDTPIFNQPALLSIIENPSTCGNADGSAQVFITGGTGPYDLYWSTGTTVIGAGSSETLMNLSSGTYYANVKNTYGCKATVSARISDSDISIGDATTDPTCSNTADGAIDITISASGNIDEIYWSTGATTEDITGLLGGEYAVEVHTDNNCHAYKEFSLLTPPPLDVDVVGVNPADCSDLITFGNSGIDISTSGGSGPYMWDWNDGAFSTEDIASIPSGPYKCVVTDNNGCSLEWWMNLPEFNGPQIVLNKIQKTACGHEDGLIDISVFQGIDPIVSTVWSNGATTEDMVDAHSGVFTVDITDAGGCVTTNRFKINEYRPAQPQICLLTVDTSLTYNTVVWEKNVTQDDLSGFNIYRETSTVGEYELIAFRDYALQSDFTDNSASPMDRSWRYYITAVDTCGNESFPSFPHKTIHCVIQDMGGPQDVYWDEYEGITYSSVDIHRYDDVNGWVTIESGYTNPPPYNDTPPVTAGLDYLVTFNLAQTCTATKAQDYNSSRSNNSSAVYNPGGSTATIQDVEVGQISIYPNPTNSILNVYIENPELFEYIEIRNVNGAVIFNQRVLDTQSEFDMSAFANGVYFVRLISSQKTINQKIIKE